MTASEYSDTTILNPVIRKRCSWSKNLCNLVLCDNMVTVKEIAGVSAGISKYSMY